MAVAESPKLTLTLRPVRLGVDVATRAGTVLAVDNRRLAQVAKCAGAPSAPTAGIELHARRGGHADTDQPPLTIHAESAGELAYAPDFAHRFNGLFALGDPL